jgi:hypothetical protein
MRALPLMLLLAVGCGKIPATNQAVPGGRVDAVVVGATATEIAQADRLCDLLETKASRLVLGAAYNFRITDTDCNGSVAPVSSVATTLQNQNGQFVYMQNNGIVISPRVETHQSGQLSVICSAQQTGLTNPLVVGTSAYWYIFEPNCAADTLCVTLTTGFRAADGRYDIALRDRFAVDTSVSLHTGKIKAHQKEQSGSCSPGSTRSFVTTQYDMVF